MPGTCPSSSSTSATRESLEYRLAACCRSGGTGPRSLGRRHAIKGCPCRIEPAATAVSSQLETTAPGSITPGEAKLDPSTTPVWKADRTVASEFLWAALDCPAIWGQIVHGGAQAGDRAVTGRQELHQHEPIRGDATSIVVGWPLERQGGKIIAG